MTGMFGAGKVARMTDHILTRLYQTLQDRKINPPEGSYVAKLYAAGPAKCAQKFGEEAVETVIEAMKIAHGDDAARALFAQEAADCLFHLMVLCARLDLSPDDIWGVLESRVGLAPRAE